MKTLRCILTSFVVAALLAAVPASAQVKDWKEIKYPPLKPFAIPEPERYVMKNGVTVFLMEDHELPLIQVQSRIRTGARFDPADKVGLASITGQVLRTGGAGSRTGDEIDDFLDGRGARIETGIGVESGTASVNCLKGDFPEVLQAFAEILRTPRFDEAKIKVAKNQARTNIARRNDEPMGIMFREASRLIYGADSPYARSTEYATIDAITQADLKAFHAKYFISNRLYLGVVGDFDSKEMKALLEKALGDWPKGPDAKDPESEYQKTPRPGLYRIVKTDMTQSDIIMGHLGIRQDNPDYFPASVMNEVLSGSSASRLFNNIRTEKGLAYSVRGSLGANFDYPGTLTLWMTTGTGNTAAAMDALLHEVDALVSAPPTDEEMARAKDSILNSFVFNYDTKIKILNQQLAYEYFGYPRDFLAKYRQNIEKVVAADVFRVAKTYVKKNDLAILVVGPTQGLDRPLDTFGKVTAIDITIPEPKQAAAAVSVPGMSEKEAAAKGAEILKKVIAAFGGETKIDAVKSVRLVANTSTVTSRGEMTMKVTQTYVLPDRVRQEMSSPMGTMTAVVTPSDAFVVTPMGIQPLPDSRRADMIKAMKRDPIVLLKQRAQPGFTVKYEGADTVENVQTDVVAVTVEGDTVRWAVDPATGRILRGATKGTGPGGVPGERVALFSDFREAAGLMMPHKTRLVFNGEPMGTMEVLEFSINVQVDESQFTRPAAAAPAPPPS